MSKIDEIMNGDIVEIDTSGDKKITVKERYKLGKTDPILKFKNKVYKETILKNIKSSLKEGSKILVIDSSDFGMTEFFLNLKNKMDITFAFDNVDDENFFLEYFDHNNVEVLRISMPFNIPLKASVFDFIFLFNKLEFLKNDELTLISLSHKLKEGGILVTSTLLNMTIYGKEDKLNGVKRRYLFGELELMFFKSGLNIKHKHIFENKLNKDILIMKKVLQDSDSKTGEISKNEESSINKILNSSFDNVINERLMIGNRVIVFLKKEKISVSKKAKFIKGLSLFNKAKRKILDLYR